MAMPCPPIATVTTLTVMMTSLSTTNQVIDGKTEKFVDLSHNAYGHFYYPPNSCGANEIPEVGDLIVWACNAGICYGFEAFTVLQVRSV